MAIWPTKLKEVINWFSFMDIMEYTFYQVENYITLLPSMLKIFPVFQMHLFWYDKEHSDQNNVKIKLYGLVIM